MARRVNPAIRSNRNGFSGRRENEGIPAKKIVPAAF
jgi:hypothetical protein